MQESGKKNADKRQVGERIKDETEELLGNVQDGKNFSDVFCQRNEHCVAGQWSRQEFISAGRSTRGIDYFSVFDEDMLH